jgi:hypothetical protein
MIHTPTTPEELLLVLRRPEVNGPIRGVPAQQVALRRCMLLKPEAVDGTLAELAQIAAKLPDDNLDPAQRAALRKQLYPEVATVLRNFAQGVRRYPAIGAPDKPQELERVARLIGLFSCITRNANHGVSRAMDLRLLLGAFQWYLLRTLLLKLTARLEDPACTPGERSRLINAFSKLLLHREKLLLSNEERLALWRTNQQKMQDEIDETERVTFVVDTMNAVRLRLPVSAETLEQAALFLHEMKQKAAAAAKDGKGKPEKEPRKTNR